MIKVDHVGLTIKKTRILDDINLKLERGKIHGLVGRNGSGKTMLMKCICGFVRPTEGRVFVDGKQIGKDADFPESLGVIIETPEFIPSLSGYDNLRMLAGGRHRIGPDEIKAAMDLVELDWKMRLHVKKYSLGMRQRLGIAQALMESPDLLVLDEPLNGLDEDGAAVGYVITVTSHEGYGGDIQFLMGVNSDGSLNGISLLSISETPGLGMQAE